LHLSLVKLFSAQKNTVKTTICIKKRALSFNIASNDIKLTNWGLSHLSTKIWSFYALLPSQAKICRRQNWNDLG